MKATLLIRAKALLPDIELAHLANDGKDYRREWCQCDRSAGMSPCEYCVIDSVLSRTARFLLELLEVEGQLEAPAP